MDTLGTHPFVLCREVVLFWRLFCIECILSVVERFVLFRSQKVLYWRFHCTKLTFPMNNDVPLFQDIDVTNELMETSTMETGAMEISAMETNTADRTVCFILFQKFIKEVSTLTFFFFCIVISANTSLKVLVRMKQYKDDLLASCLQLLLSLPKELVQIELDGLVPALQVKRTQRNTYSQ